MISRLGRTLIVLSSFFGQLGCGRDTRAPDAKAYDAVSLHLDGLIRTGQFAGGDSLASKLIALSPQRFEAYYYRAFARRQLGDRSGARTDIESARTYAPETRRGEIRSLDSLLLDQQDSLDMVRKGFAVEAQRLIADVEAIATRVLVMQNPNDDVGWAVDSLRCALRPVDSGNMPVNVGCGPLEGDDVVFLRDDLFPRIVADVQKGPLGKWAPAPSLTASHPDWGDWHVAHRATLGVAACGVGYWLEASGKEGLYSECYIRKDQ